MTPQEITDYKQKWMSTKNYSVIFNDSMDVKAKDWCRRHLERHQWSMSAWTSQFEHTMFFEKEKDALKFASFIR